MKNKITAHTVRNLQRCGGYGGGNGCDHRETSFGNYLYMLYQLTFRGQEESEISENEIYQQAKVDTMKELLDGIAETYIDEDNMEIHFDHKDFHKVGGKLSENEGLMPYVIHYVALRKGFDFAPGHEKVLYGCKYEKNMKLIHCAPVKDEEMIKSVVNTVNKDYAKWKSPHHLNLEEFLPSEKTKQ